MDREKAIKGFDLFIKQFELFIKEIPVCTGEVELDMFRNVLALLKEQEAIKPKSKSRHGEYPQIVHRCGNCNEILYRYYKYCPSCGRSVKWE